MESQSKILLISKENTTVDMVKSALGSRQSIVLGAVYQEIVEIRGYLSNTRTQAVVVDIDPDPSRILYDLEAMVTAYPETRFVVVSNKFSQESVLEAMQAGARHFLPKKSIALELDKVLDRLLCDGEKRAVKLGSIISVFSAGGGCGATTVALNLANELRLASSENVLAIDLDSYYGTVSAYLGVTGQYGIADVLSRKGQIDKHLIETSACNYMKDFHVLISPATLNNGHSKVLQYQNLTDTLEACKHAYSYTVIDAPRVAETVLADLANVSKFSVIVFQLTVTDLKVARFILSCLDRNGIPREKILPLANRCRRRGPFVRLEDSNKALSLDSLHCIRSDWRKAMSCINRGKPLAQVAPRSGLRRDFQKLAGQIHASDTNGNGSRTR